MVFDGPRKRALARAHAAGPGKSKGGTHSIVTLDNYATYILPTATAADFHTN